jgi:hypothetical protein
MTTYYGYPIEYTAVTAANCRQYFCTVAELMDDLNLNGAEKTDKLMRAVLDASIFLANRIGEFIPVTETRFLTGSGARRMYLPPLLAVTTIVNDDLTLTGTDYVLQPGGGHWRNGPYSWIEVAEDAANLSIWEPEAEAVVITGRWGKYEETALTGATLAAEQKAVDTTSQVSDGSKLSPGMTLQLGTEQELVTGYSAPTTSVTTLSAALDNNSETLSLTSGALVKAGEIIRINFERMRVEEIQTNEVAVTRGWDGTKKVAHLSAAGVDVYRTFTVDRAVNGTTAALHANALAVSRYLIPGDMNYLARQIAALMLKKAQAGFAGKTGNAELGEVYYNNEFPKIALAEIERNYEIPRSF